MSKPYNKILAATAALTVGVSGKAQATYNNLSDPKITAIYNEVIASTATRTDLVQYILEMNKKGLEDAMEVDLSNEEFLALNSMIIELMGEQVDVKPVHPGKMILSTQEYASQ